MEFSAVTIFLNGLAFAGFGFVVLVASRLMGNLAAARGNDALFWTMRVMAWAMMCIGCLAVCVAMSGALAVLLMAVMLVVALETFLDVRRTRQNGLLSAMAVASDRFIPLVPAIEAFADEGADRFAYRVRMMADELRRGVPLPLALSHWRGVVPRMAVAMIAVGCDVGAMSAGIRAATATRRSLWDIWASLSKQIGYLLWTFAMGSGVLIFVMLKIVPAMQKIFEDFDTELPAMTQFLVSLSFFSAGFGGLIVVFGWGALALLALYLISCYLGFLPAFFPGVMWLRKLDGAYILDALAMVVEKEQPVSVALRRLAELYPKAAIRLRLFGTLDDVEAGRCPWHQALGVRKLLSSADVALLDAAQRAGNLPWTLRELAENHRQRFGRRARILLQYSLPAMVLTLGAMVGFVVVGLFVPLVALIQKLLEVA